MYHEVLIRGTVCVLVDKEYAEVLSNKRLSLISSNYVWVYDSETKSGEYLHRFIIGDAARGLDVDHINGNKLDNRRVNLRTCTRSENLRNAKRPDTKKDGLPKGVYKHTDTKRKKPYQVKFKFENTWVCYGYYKTVCEAEAAYLRAIEFYHGQFAYHTSRKEEVK